MSHLSVHRLFMVTERVKPKKGNEKVFFKYVRDLIHFFLL